jgi:hypothetical protein
MRVTRARVGFAMAMAWFLFGCKGAGGAFHVASAAAHVGAGFAKAAVATSNVVAHAAAAGPGPSLPAAPAPEDPPPAPRARCSEPQNQSGFVGAPPARRVSCKGRPQPVAYYPSP